MELSRSQIQKLLKNRGSWTKVGSLKSYESRLRVVSEPLFFYELERETAWNEIKRAIKNRVAPEKYEKTMLMFDFPLPVTSITSDIMGDLNRVWNGRNANFFVQFPNKRAEDVSQEILFQLNTRKFVEKVGRKAFQCKPQTIVIVDKDEKGVPYYIALDCERVLDYETSPCGEDFNWIMFKHSVAYGEDNSVVEKIGLYDSEFYRVITLGKNEQIISIEEQAHDLGYCPARWFIDKPLNTKKDEKRYSPLGNVLGMLSRWTQFDAYSNYAELYSTFPVVEYAAAACENEYCTNGMISQPTEGGGWTAPKACTSCNNNTFSGPGTSIKINPSIDKDENDEKGYFRFISPPTQNLEYEDAKQNARENSIKLNTTGANSVIEKEAVNDAQIASLMEDRKNPLLVLSGIASRVHEWLQETALFLWLGVEVKSTANYGTEWFLMNEAQLQKLFENAKNAGLPESELDQIYKLLIETKYKAQPRLIKKLLIEHNLNPAPYNTLGECYEKVSNGVMQANDLYIKANITKFIAKFERENGSIVDFGSEVSFEQKINSIYNSLIKYVENEKKEEANTNVQTELD